MGKYALLLVSALIFSLLTYSYALKNALFQSNVRTVQSFSQNQAHNIAHSAAMVAFNEILNNSDTDFVPDLDDSYSYPNDGSFANWNELHGKYRLDMVNQGDSMLTLQSTGQFEESEYIVTVGLFRNNGLTSWDGALIDKAVHAENDIDMGNGTIDGDVSLNNGLNAIDLKGEITGNFFFYDTNEPSGQAEDGFKGVEGETANMSEKIVHNDPVFPPFPTSYMPVENNGNSRYFYANDIKNKKFGSFSTKKNTTINIGDEDVILYADNINLSGGLTVIGDGTLSIYVENNLVLKNGDINAGNGSQHLGIYYNGSEDIQYSGNGIFSGLLFIKNDGVDFKISGNPDFTSNLIHLGAESTIDIAGNPGVSSLVYAPYSTVNLKGTGNRDFRGAIVSDQFSANGRASVIYDADFASTLPSLNQESDGDGLFTITYWN